MKNTAFRPASVPLATIDPYFSLWSFADHFTDDSTRHWTGRRMAMTGIIRYDGNNIIFMGKATGFDRNYIPASQEWSAIPVSTFRLPTGMKLNSQSNALSSTVPLSEVSSSICSTAIKISENKNLQVKSWSF